MTKDVDFVTDHPLISHNAMLFKTECMVSSQALFALAWTNTWGEDSCLDKFTYLDSAPWTYENADIGVPVISNLVTEVRANVSYIVKVPRLGCPFRLHAKGVGYGYFESPPRNSALVGTMYRVIALCSSCCQLLKFTISVETRNLQLDSHHLWP